MPKTSRLLDEFTSTNKLNLLHDKDRARALSFLISVKAKAPVLHMSFSVDPSPAFIQKLMTWLRAEIHPLVLVHVGLQPNIGAGCVVRGTNKYFDFSLRQHFKKQRSLLMEKLQGDMQQQAATSEAPQQTPQQPAAPENLQQLAKEVEAMAGATDLEQQVQSPAPATEQQPAVQQQAPVSEVPKQEAPHA
jgi:hypothetical protein